jgi:hypothetical protein
MTDYFYIGDVILTWPCGKVAKRRAERIIQADSEHDAYARLTNDILTEEVYSKEYPNKEIFAWRIVVPSVEFNGEMIKAKPYPEKDDKRTEELELRIEGLEKQMAGVYDILDKVADSDKASVDLFRSLTDKVMELEKKVKEDADG